MPREVPDSPGSQRLSEDGHPPDHLRLYAGRWIACLGDRVIGQGGTPSQALLAAKAARYKENPQVVYVSPSQPLVFSNLLERISAILPPDCRAYLVGGAVRDALLNRPTHDMDFVLEGEALRVGRQVANALKAAFYPLDEERDTGRVLWTDPEGEKRVLDFAVQRGPDLESDLRSRDFTLNAMAVEVRSPQALLDPLGGAADLRARQLRACSSTSFKDDPVRILRGVRLAAAFDFHILPDTRQQMRQSVSQLQRVSPERLRDELFRILEGSQPVAALRALDMLGALAYVLPDLAALKGVEQSPPHREDVWAHTFHVMKELRAVLGVLALQYDPDASAGLALGLVSLRLGRFREQFHTHLESPFTSERPLRSLLYLAALYHDAGKPQTRQVEEGGRIRFFEHERLGARIAAERARALRLSGPECDRLEAVVRHHMRPLLLAQSERIPTRRAIYRFFRDTGEAGVDVCLLSLADTLATYGPGLPVEVWKNQLDVVRALLEARWERPEEVSPPSLVNGHDLMMELGLQPGPEIGRLLEAVREAQAVGQIHSRQEALDLARTLHP